MLLIYNHDGSENLGLTAHSDFYLYSDDPAWFHCWVLPYDRDIPNRDDANFQPVYLFADKFVHYWSYT